MPTRQRFECALLLVFVWLLPACLDRPVAAATPALESALSEVISIDPGIKVDLLVMVDNSSSMRERQRNILRQLGPMIEQLTNPPCISRSTPGGGTPRPCDLHNPDETRQYPPIDDLHLAVVSSDLGTPGSTVPSCDRGDTGDDGLFNPIRNGAALREHLPWAPRSPGAERAPADLRPTTCDNNPFQFPSFIAFCSDDAHRSCDRSGAFASTRDPNAFTDWFRCNAGLFVNGCELESQLESVWRALVHHDARESSGNASPNAGFLRDDALLAIVMLSDEEDGSVRNCDNDQGFSSQNGAPCRDARAVYDSQSTSWSATGLDQRFYRYQPGGEQDPTWNLDRYYNTRPANTPNRWTRDLLSLKPGHPERIVFAGILGVPLVIPTRTEGTERRIVWDQLLGAPAAASPEDFYGRDSATAISGTQGTAGPFSMRAANPDPLCEHVVPACRTEDSTYDPARACAGTSTSPGQSLAFPSRRIVEIARRFDETPACNGQPCRNGFVTSICANDFSSAMSSIVSKLARRLRANCLPRQLEVRQHEDETESARCVVHTLLPLGQTLCDPARGQHNPELPEDRRFLDLSGTFRTVCEIDQLRTHRVGTPRVLQPSTHAPGWYYDRTPQPGGCTSRVRFTYEAQPDLASTTRLECVQSIARP